MIGRLRGRLDLRGSDHVLIDVGGVGYLVYCSDRTLAGLPDTGNAVSLYTDMLVREDLIQLFGFSSLVEKEWHRLLTGVQGVGAKASLSILGALGAEGVSRAIALGDWKSVTAAKGIGPKIAQRIVLDLNDKAPAVMTMSGAEAPAMLAQADPVAAAGHAGASAQADALSALGNLGYAPGDAAAAVSEAAGRLPEAGEAELIRAALKLLAPKS